MKMPQALLAVGRPQPWIISLMIHLLIFSIPVSMAVKPHLHDLELFISLGDPERGTALVRPLEASTRPQPRPVKASGTLLPTKIISPEAATPVKEARSAPVEARQIEQAKADRQDSPAIESRPGLLTTSALSLSRVSDDVPFGTGEQRPAAGNSVDAPVETRFGESVAPAFLHRELPVYPMMARTLGREGKVVLKLMIDETGKLMNVDVLQKAGYGFTEAAVEAVRKSTFRPATKDGKPIASRVLLPVRFQLQRN